MKAIPVGIDLGTTNSLIAVWQDGKAHLIPNSLGQVLTPSAVSVDEDESLLVGAAAAARRVSHPERTAVAFKRFMGADHRFDLADGHSYTPTELSSFVLSSLKQDAESYLGQEIKDVVISVPAYFNDEQRKHTAFAAELAGLNAVRLINEPTAAAMAYGLHEDADRLSLVFDLGGGTFDVTLLEYIGPVIEVRSSTGDNFLGGEDFTGAIVDACLEDWGLVRDSIDSPSLAVLVAKAEQMKCLSTHQRDQLVWSWNGKTWQWPAADGVTKVWKPLLDRLRQPLERALRDSKIDPRSLDSIVMVGGGTRLWETQQLVSQLFGKMPLRSLDPDTVVALGAAAQAACRLRDDAVQEIIMTDVCPYTLGIAISTDVNGERVDGLMSPIIERNTTIPASREQIYSTSRDGQEAVSVVIFQGERPRVNDNVFIGDITVPVPPAPAGREGIAVRFSYNIDGLLEVDVTVLSTGEKTERLIDRSPNGLTEEEKRASQERLSRVKIHPRDEMPNRTLRARLESAYSQALGQEREQIMGWLNEFEVALSRQDPSEIARLRETLDNAIREMS